MTNLMNTSTTMKMNSIEIAELVESRHDKVKQSIERLVANGAISQPPSGEVRVQRERRAESVEVYTFTGEQGRRDSIVVVAQLSPLFTARLVDRWQELEAKMIQLTKPLFVLPDFTDPVEAATAWIEQYKEKQVALKQLELAAPKVQFVDDYVDTTGSKSFREVANIFKANERKFRKFLQEHGMMYQKKNKDWAAYSKFIDKKMLQHKIIVNQDTGRSYTLVYFTPLGIEYTAKKWNEYLAK